jgi:hypothetical protein
MKLWSTYKMNKYRATEEIQTDYAPTMTVTVGSFSFGALDFLLTHTSRA